MMNAETASGRSEYAVYNGVREIGAWDLSTK
jgi:hypothetical protein